MHFFPSQITHPWIQFCRKTSYIRRIMYHFQHTKSQSRWNVSKSVGMILIYSHVELGQTSSQNALFNNYPHHFSCSILLTQSLGMIQQNRYCWRESVYPCSDLESISITSTDFISTAWSAVVILSTLRKMHGESPLSNYWLWSSSPLREMRENT